MTFNPSKNQGDTKSSKKRSCIYEGPSKMLMDSSFEDSFVLHFKDTISQSFSDFSFINHHRNSKVMPMTFKKEYTIPGKGAINNRMSEMFFKNLSDCRIANHFIERLNMKEQRVQACTALPFKVIVHNFASPSFAKRMDLETKHFLSDPIIEFVYTLKDGTASFVSDKHLLAFNMASQDEIEEIMTKANRANDFLSGQFASVGLKLINFSLEFGRFSYMDFYNSCDLLIIDEITPETLCLFDINSNEFWDKDSIVQDLESNNATKIYQKIAYRFGIS
ncbi:MAG: Phosphoribosylaminoimidazole-succinocarboxamide synthase [Holosporales bacterium]